LHRAVPCAEPFPLHTHPPHFLTLLRSLLQCQLPERALLTTPINSILHPSFSVISSY
jgi:hypothetical protein